MNTQKKNSRRKSQDVSWNNVMAETTRMEFRSNSASSMRCFSKYWSGMRCRTVAEARHIKTKSADSGSLRLQSWETNTRYEVMIATSHWTAMILFLSSRTEVP